MNSLEITNLYKSITKKPVLKDVSLTIGAGEIVGLIGPNGAGKSTIMKTVASLIYPDSGEIIIYGKSLAKEREGALAHLSAMIEAPALYPQFTGLQHLNMVARLRRLPAESVEQGAAFSKLGDRLGDKVTKYSMGMKQRLYLTMSVMVKPKLLILDEPTNGIDFTNVVEFCSKMRAVAAAGTAILISSHILGDMQKLADRFVFLKAGEIQRVVQKTDGMDIEQIYLDIFGVQADG